MIWVGCGLLIQRLLPDPAIPRALLAPLGFCLVVVVGGFTTASSSLAELTTPLVVVLAVTGFAVQRWDFAHPSRWLIGALLAVWAAYAAPIVLSGGATFAGYIKLDDTATWLALTDRVMEAGRSLEGLDPSSYEATLAFNLADGYPIGAFIPFGVGQALIGLDAAWLIQPYIALLAALLAMGLWALSARVIDDVRLRAAVVALASQPALLYGYYLWGGLKELAAAAVITLVANLAPVATTADARVRSVIPVALTVAGLIGCLSLAGFVWLGPMLVGLFVLAVSAASLQKAFLRALTLTGVTALLIVPVLLGDSLLPPTSSPLDDPAAKGNLIEALSPIQALGVWPAGDFRVDPDSLALTIGLCLGAILAVIAAWLSTAAASRWAHLSYILGVPAAAAIIALIGSPWVEGKAFATVSPVLLFAAFCGCIWMWGKRRLAVGGVLGLALAVGVIWSNALAYHEASLAPRGQLSELEEIAALIGENGPVLMTEYQPYGVRHFLREADAEGASELRRRLVPLTDGSSLGKGLWADTDAFRPDALKPYSALVLRRSPEQSRPPGEFSRAWSGEFYELWTRDEDTRPAAERLPLGAGALPIAEPRCSEVHALAEAVPGGSLRAARSEASLFLDRNALGWPRQWEVDAGRPLPEGDGDLIADVSVQGGRYSVWLGGSVRGSAELRIDGERIRSRRHQLNNSGLYVELGVVDLAEGDHRLVVQLGGGDLAPGSGGPREAVGPIVIGPGPGADSEVIEVDPADAEELCGQRWDWVEAVP